MMKASSQETAEAAKRGAHPMNRFHLLLALLLGGCAHYPVNAPLTHAAPEAGYRFNERRHASATPAPSGGSANRPAPEDLQFYPIEVNFDALPNESDRKFFKSLPTSLKLPPATVDRVRSAAARLLRQSENYQKLLRDLGEQHF